MKLLYSLVILASLFLFSCTKEGGSKNASTTDELFSGITGTSSNPGGSGNNQAGVITAGEWNDLNHWDFWLNLHDKDVFNEVKSSYRYDLAAKITVKLLSADNVPLEDEPVSVQKSDGTILWESHTDNKGIAQLFIGKAQRTASFKIYVPDRGFSAPGVYSTEIREYQVPVTVGTVSNADIAFVVDATGSMGDEITYLKTELLDVINRVKSNHPDMVLRTGSIFYRDEGDEYVTRKSDFSGNSSTTIDFIRNQSAGGGGDFPEAVHTAVKEAVEQLAWSAKAKSKIMFLILDAPPHENEAVLATLEAQVKAAARKGIRIVPVTASGINKLTEYLMRQIAIATNGTYVFITNHSGIGNNHIEATVGDYEVEYLNNLMVRVTNKYLE
jgi:von Willebrand factor type A domain-containing protein